jgi:hypothetical protein
VRRSSTLERHRGWRDTGITSRLVLALETFDGTGSDSMKQNRTLVIPPHGDPCVSTIANLRLRRAALSAAGRLRASSASDPPSPAGFRQAQESTNKVSAMPEPDPRCLELRERITTLEDARRAVARWSMETATDLTAAGHDKWARLVPCKPAVRRSSSTTPQTTSCTDSVQVTPGTEATILSAASAADDPAGPPSVRRKQGPAGETFRRPSPLGAIARRLGAGVHRVLGKVAA